MDKKHERETNDSQSTQAEGAALGLDVGTSRLVLDRSRGVTVGGPVVGPVVGRRLAVRGAAPVASGRMVSRGHCGC